MKEKIKDLIPYVIIVIVVVLIRTFLITPIKVQGTSMYDTLNDKDIMILNKVANIDRYDIVVINSKAAGEVLIKRVIALPGETIRITDGKIYINDKEINDKYGIGITSDLEEVKVLSNEYFVLGDNREVSADSRLYGTIKKDEIKGTSRLIIFPFKNFGFVK